MGEKTVATLWPLAEKYLTLDMLSENLPGAFLIYRAIGEGEILFASRGLVQLFECDSMEDFIRFTGGCFDTLVYPEDIEKVNRAVWDQISASGGYDYVRYRVITKNGRIKTIDDWGHLVHNKELNEDLFYVYLHDRGIRDSLNAIASVNNMPDDDDISDSETQREIDELTGLINMRAFRIKAKDEIKKILDEGRSAYCIYFNIRNFHTYNETYGFAGGDRMLKSIARILQETFTEGLVSHFVHDHFVVITAQDDLQERIGRMGVRINNIRRGVIVEMKAGVYAIKDENEDISFICDSARLACDSIKRAFGTTVQFYDGKIDERGRMRDYIMANFQSAMDNGNISVFIQPVVNVSTKQIMSMEALARWSDPLYGNISPALFIDVLEEFRQIHKLDTFVIRESCAEIRRRIDSNLPVAPVSINLSRLDFELTDIVTDIENMVEEFGLENSHLSFEVTESLIAADADALRQETDRLREHGFKVWMDAFGGGYSSFKMLRDFSLDGLKIDMDMLQSYDNDKAHAIVETVIALAKRLGIPALSQGVETQEQLAFLKEAGCDLAQGYLFGKPIPASEHRENNR